MRQIRHLRIIVWVIGMAAILMGFVQSALGQTPFPSDDEVNVIARQLYCPVCENIPLDVCGTKVCAEWREVIREKLAQGWTENQINDYFVQQYGDQVLAKPPRRGINWLLYMLPPVAVSYTHLTLPTIYSV